MKIRKLIYQEIYDYIIEKIQSGDYHPDDQLPSEHELEVLFESSRTPVRQALNQLENDGYIYRLQGRGSFVSDRKPAEFWTTMTGFRSQYLENWEKVSSKTLELLKKKDPFYANLLRTNEDEEITYIKRVRYYDEIPIMFLEHYISPNIPIKVFEDEGDFTSLQKILGKIGIHLSYVEEELEAVPATDELARILQVQVKTSLLKVTRISYDDNYFPIDVNIYYVRTDKWKYRVNFRDS